IPDWIGKPGHSRCRGRRLLGTSRVDLSRRRQRTTALLRRRRAAAERPALAGQPGVVRVLPRRQRRRPRRVSPDGVDGAGRRRDTAPPPRLPQGVGSHPAPGSGRVGRVSAPMLPGRPAPLGATPGPQGTNFAVSSNGDEVRLCLFSGDGSETQLLVRERDGDVWHGFVPGVAPGQAYGYRVSGPYDRARGQRYNPVKLLLDPYARAINGDVRFGPELLDYAMDNAGAPSALDSSGQMPRSVVTAHASTPLPPGPGHALADTILYEVHVRGFTAKHPGVPPELRGTYAGLAHEAAVQHLVDLGVTTVELLPIHHNVPESFLVERGLTNYWGYNTIGF